MTKLPQGPDPQPDTDLERRQSLPDWAVGLLTVQAIAVGIGLVMPITPSKTGSDWSFAELFTADPSYLQKALVGFIFTNILIAIFLLIVWLFGRFSQSDDSPAD